MLEKIRVELPTSLPCYSSVIKLSLCLENIVKCRCSWFYDEFTSLKILESNCQYSVSARAINKWPWTASASAWSSKRSETTDAHKNYTKDHSPLSQPPKPHREPRPRRTESSVVCEYAMCSCQYMLLPIIYHPFHYPARLGPTHVLLPITRLGSCQLHHYMVRILPHTEVIPATHVLLPIHNAKVFLGP